MANSFGRLFRLTTFGESHGSAMGGIIDGCPAGLKLDLEAIQEKLNQRKPGSSSLYSQRKEQDEFEILSGIFEGITLGTPIGFILRNKDVRSQDYDHLKETYRPSHADYTYQKKYGIRDHRGGGRASVRDSVSWVLAGAIAEQLLSNLNITVAAYTSQIGECRLSRKYQELDVSQTYNSAIRCPDAWVAREMEQQILQTKEVGDTLGGTVSCIVRGVPVGWGEPVFDKLHANLGKAMLSINAVKGFEFGSGFDSVTMKGSEHNDKIESIAGEVKHGKNYSGGIQGGISNGEDIYFKVAFKPVSTIMQSQDSIDKEGNKVKLAGKGRHDPCVVPRAVPIVEALTLLVLVDAYLLSKTNKL